MGTDVEVIDPGGGGPECIGGFIQSGRAGGVAFWGRDMGLDPPDGVGPEKISAQGRATAHREASEAVGGG